MQFEFVEVEEEGLGKGGMEGGWEMAIDVGAVVGGSVGGRGRVGVWGCGSGKVGV